MGQHIYYSQKENTLITYKDGCLRRVSKKDLTHTFNFCNPTAISVWVNDSYRKEDEEFEYQFIYDFGKLILPNQPNNGWLINQNSKFQELSEDSKEQIRKFFDDKYGTWVMNSKKEVNVRIVEEFDDLVQKCKDKMAYEFFEVA